MDDHNIFGLPMHAELYHRLLTKGRSLLFGEFARKRGYLPAHETIAVRLCGRLFAVTCCHRTHTAAPAIGIAIAPKKGERDKSKRYEYATACWIIPRAGHGDLLCIPPNWSKGVFVIGDNFGCFSALPTYVQRALPQLPHRLPSSNGWRYIRRCRDGRPGTYDLPGENFWRGTPDDPLAWSWSVSHWHGLTPEDAENEKLYDSTDIRSSLSMARSLTHRLRKLAPGFTAWPLAMGQSRIHLILYHGMKEVARHRIYGMRSVIEARDSLMAAAVNYMVSPRAL